MHIVHVLISSLPWLIGLILNWPLCSFILEEPRHPCQRRAVFLFPDFLMLLRPRPAESEAVAMGTTHKDEVEERRERDAYIHGGGREEACDAAAPDWLQAPSNPTHSSLRVIISGAKLVTAAAAGSLSSSPRFIESLSAMLCPVCRPVTQPKDAR